MSRFFFIEPFARSDHESFGGEGKHGGAEQSATLVGINKSQGTRCVSLYVPEEFRDFITEEAETRGVSVSQLIQDCLTVAFYETGDDRIPLPRDLSRGYLESLGANDDLIEEAEQAQKRLDEEDAADDS